METHKGAVARLAEEVARFYSSRTPFWIYHGSKNCTRQVSFDRSGIVDTSNLNHVLEINSKSMVVIAEPNVPMYLLVQTTLKHGLIPPVVPEFPAGESSSFKYGYFDRIVNSVEIILANGEVTRVSQTDEKKDLFNGAAGAFGTLGVLTLLEIQLIPAKTYVALTYIPVVDTKDAIATLRECVIAEKQPFDFVDGIQFSKDLGVICVGHMTDTCTNTPQTFSGPWDPWFYMHAQSRCSSGSKEIPLTDTIPLQDYLFRYDRGAFWMGKYYPLFPFSFLNNTFSRWFWDSFLHTRVLFQSMHISNRSQKFIIQDLGLPMHKAEEFLDFVDEELGIYPLWLCPLTIGREVNFQRLAINVGVWGPGPEDFGKFVAENRRLERRLEEFWQLYDREQYEGLRKKYCAESLPNVYTKVKSTEVEFPRKDLKATWHGLYGHFLGFKVQYLLSGEKRKGE
ncbi:FAD-binding domain-containing protein [Hyaloscypha hepaticicola]|uniref:Delta(24)-sterol reductase n=1 Tax=Hyaloscypha hepaticicola TaxID=2082293 RepID=A0A2J6QJK5_9HELO|nr:FAD-binding domain-containing protein [Hyaloscypha hepaticicola]